MFKYKLNNLLFIYFYIYLLFVLTILYSRKDHAVYVFTIHIIEYFKLKCYHYIFNINNRNNNLVYFKKNKNIMYLILNKTEINNYKYLMIL